MSPTKFIRIASLVPLRQHGALTLTIPQALGGKGYTLYELLLCQERLAKGSGSTALALGWHQGLQTCCTGCWVCMWQPLPSAAFAVLLLSGTLPKQDEAPAAAAPATAAPVSTTPPKPAW